MTAWLTWQAVRLFLGDKLKAAFAFARENWRDVLIAVMALWIWHQRAQLAACHAFKAA